MLSIELPIQAQDLVKAYQHSIHFRDIYQYILMENSHPVSKCKIVLERKHLIMLLLLYFDSREQNLT